MTRLDRNSGRPVVENPGTIDVKMENILHIVMPSPPLMAIEGIPVKQARFTLTGPF